MSITVEINGKVANIELSGRIDYATREEFRQANIQALSAENVEEIQVNLAKTTFLDSSGIRALITLQREADASGRSLTLYNCNETMQEVFELAGLNLVFTFR